MLATVGYGFGDDWRTEFEAGYRDNDVDTYTSHGAPVTDVTGDLSEVSLMANVLYDIPLTERCRCRSAPAPAATSPSSMHGATAVSLDDDHWSFAYQGIAGLNYAIGQRTSLFVNYRYLARHRSGVRFPPPVLSGFFEGDDIVKHTATIGLRYAFGAAAAPEAYVAPPPPPPAQEAAAPVEFIVFFGHNKSNLTPEAMKVIREAAAAAKQYGSATISVVGHADRSGSTHYNDALSLRRGQRGQGRACRRRHPGRCDLGLRAAAKATRCPHRRRRARTAKPPREHQDVISHCRG